MAIEGLILGCESNQSQQATTFDMYPLTLVSSVALLAAGFLLYRVTVWYRDSLSHIPYHKFDEDDTPQRYARETEELVHSGYLKVGFPQ